MTHDIFISYRREGGGNLVRSVTLALKARGFSVFMVVEDLKSGPFDEVLIGKIEEVTDFRWNGPTPSHEMFEASIDRLVSKFLKSKSARKLGISRRDVLVGAGVTVLGGGVVAAVANRSLWWPKSEHTNNTIHPGKPSENAGANANNNKESNRKSPLHSSSGSADTKTIKNSQNDAEIVLIAAGDFLMGDLPHKQQMSAYYIYKNLVTVEQYLKFSDATGHTRPAVPTFNPDWNNIKHPIVNVYYEDAQAYCEWASKGNVKVTLPSEAQWEKAARGTDGKKYPWGDEEPAKANAGNLLWSSIDSAKSGTSRVGQFAPNEYGLYDMAGNVWEWTSSLYDDKHDWRIVRGGSWSLDNPVSFRAANRGAFDPKFTYGDDGFRCASGL